jgi:hypothetical protein
MWNLSIPVETIKEKETSSPGLVVSQNYSSGIANKIFEDKIEIEVKVLARVEAKNS